MTIKLCAIVPPKPIGYYELDTGSQEKFKHTYRIYVYERPKLINRFFMKWLLGFKYYE